MSELEPCAGQVYQVVAGARPIPNLVVWDNNDPDGEAVGVVQTGELILALSSFAVSDSTMWKWKVLKVFTSKGVMGWIFHSKHGEEDRNVFTLAKPKGSVE